MPDGKKVFLGGTCNGSAWRHELVPMLTIDYFNPVVSDWNEEAQREEIKQRELCDYVLYTITPRMTGVYSIAEAVDDSNKRPEKTIFCLLNKDVDDAFQDIMFDKRALKSLESVAVMIQDNGGKVFRTLETVAQYLNGF